jgi:small conductance mechanosensitive channel
VIIEEPEVTGIEVLSPDGITVRVLVKTAPLQQWAVARTLRQRIKSRFDHEGIEVPFTQRVIWQREDREDTGGGAADATSDAG